jgi:hypothetical protein
VSDRYPIPKPFYMLEHQLLKKSSLWLASHKITQDLQANAWKRVKDTIVVLLLGIIGLIGLCLLVHSHQNDGAQSSLTQIEARY